MIQPATLRLESNVEQQNTTYLNVEALQMVSMLQLQMLVSKLVILILGVYKQHWYQSTNGSLKIHSSLCTDIFTYNL